MKRKKLVASSPLLNLRKRNDYRSDQWKDRKDYSNTGRGGGEGEDVNVQKGRKKSKKTLRILWFSIKNRNEE
jgi:hypothetical protein